MPPCNTIDALAQHDETPAAVRASSPLSSVSSMAPRDSGATPGPDSTSVAPPNKKRKLTPAEKEAARVEKERLLQEKAAQKAQKDEEKRVKLEEKKARDEEKEEKRRMRDADKAAKEQERKKKQDEKDAEQAKKERAQPKLDFFGITKSNTLAAAKPSTPGVSMSVDGPEDAVSCSTTPSKPMPPKSTEGFVCFPFAPPSDSIIAPYNRFTRDGPALSFVRREIETLFAAGQPGQSYTSSDRKRILDDCFQPPVKRRRYRGLPSVKAIIASIQGSQNEPIDLTSSVSRITSPLEALSRIPVKQLQYDEDVRPPYIGTYTKIPTGRSVKSLSRRPFERALPGINYDYDSEAEWEEPGEGEDLVSEGEEEPDEDLGDEMEGFLDDEDSENDLRRRQVADVPPLQTGLHWETGRRTAKSDTVMMGEGELDLQTYRIETLLEEPLTCIDPFNFAYWQSVPMTAAQDGLSNMTSVMAPPRLPLSSIPGAANLPVSSNQSSPGSQPNSSNTGKVDGMHGPKWNIYPGTTVMNPGKSKAGRPPSQPLPPELMDPFKAAILEHHMITKAGMIEILKSKFPSVAKSTVTETLERVAARIGEKQAEKHWVLKA